MPASAVSIVLFDLGGVLFRYQPDVRWQAFAEQTDLTPEEIRRRLSSSGYAMACDQGRFRGNRAYREGILLLGSRMSTTPWGMYRKGEREGRHALRRASQ